MKHKEPLEKHWRATGEHLRAIREPLYTESHWRAIREPLRTESRSRAILDFASLDFGFRDPGFWILGFLILGLAIRVLDPGLGFWFVFHGLCGLPSRFGLYQREWFRRVAVPSRLPLRSRLPPPSSEVFKVVSSYCHLGRSDACPFKGIVCISESGSDACRFPHGCHSDP